MHRLILHLIINILYTNNALVEAISPSSQPHIFRDECLASLSTNETIEQEQANLGVSHFIDLYC